MDREDRIFVKTVGSKMFRMLKTGNPKLYRVFIERCRENSDKPDIVLGTRALMFAKSVIEEGSDYAMEVLSKSIKLSLLEKRDKIAESLDTILELRKKLSDTGSDEIDKLVVDILKRELRKSVSSPVDMLVSQEQPQKIRIDENTLAMMTPEQLDALAELAKYVKEEKLKAYQMSSEDLEEVKDEFEGEVEEFDEGGEEIGEIAREDTEFFEDIEGEQETTEGA